MSHITRIERRVSESNLENESKQVRKKSRSLALLPAKKEDFQLPERLQALLTDDFDHEEFQSKLELLKCRYKHAVKSELISFCYASTDAAGDAGLVAETNRSPEFVRTLMNIVEKDKEIADLAVNLVEEIDLMEKAKVQQMSKQRPGNEPEDPLFKAIWENHEKSRKQVAKFLEEERYDIYGEKDIGKQVNLPNATDDEDEEEDPPVWARTNFDKWVQKPVAQTHQAPEKVPPVEMPTETDTLSEAELREKEVAAGMQNLLDRLGCGDSVPVGATCEQKLALIQERLRNLKEQVNGLRQTSSAPLPATNAESTTAVTGSSSE